MAKENDNQWEDMDYAEENADEDESVSYDEEDSEIDDSSDYEAEGDDEEYDEEYDEDDDIQAANPPKKSPLVLILLLIFLLCAIGVLAVTKFTGGQQTASNSSDSVPSIEKMDGDSADIEIGNGFFDDGPAQDGSSDMMSVDFNDNGSSAMVSDSNSLGTAATVTDVNSVGSANTNDLFDAGFGGDLPNAGAKGTAGQMASPNASAGAGENVDNLLGDTPSAGNSNNSIMVAWNKSARQNPFKPIVVNKTKEDSIEKIGDIQFEIIEPPTQFSQDPNLTKLLQTQISGILYDDVSPSAIVNLAGKDRFVKIGDVISGYKIKNITKDKVEISYKNNTYVASVGELFSPGQLESNPAVANLNNKFAGRYKDE